MRNTIPSDICAGKHDTRGNTYHYDTGPLIRQYGDKKADARKPIQKELTTKSEEARRSTVKKDREACNFLACKNRLVIRERK